ncbi:pore-forming ESAT-6 family protein [Paracoccus marcusii]|uniref:pore-forming ESAT-6 family protein n=1 Tax=Paracoccus marcusii TaxID=59779 RepID=UPI00373529DB
MIGAGLMPVMSVVQPALDTEATWQAASNQLGILQYCEEKGFTGPEVVQAQAQIMTMLPSGDEAAETAAIEQGNQSIVAFNDQEITLSDAAASQGSTVEGTCQEIEPAVNDMAANLPAG